MPWPSAHTRSTESSARLLFSATGGPKIGPAQPPHALIHEVMPNPHVPLPPGFHTFDFNVGDGSVPDLDDEVGSDDDGGYENKDEIGHEDNNHVVISKPPVKRGKTLRPGGPPYVDPERAERPCSKKYALFEDGKMINWLCHPSTPVEWINDALAPQSAKTVSFVFHWMSCEAFKKLRLATSLSNYFKKVKGKYISIWRYLEYHSIDFSMCKKEEDLIWEVDADIEVLKLQGVQVDLPVWHLISYHETSSYYAASDGSSQWLCVAAF
ncbi:hypothetical protein FRC10_000419 [Ceratobasidium sp. 414]|nr:hypothetical protein FRC10_000419 [Ceratobasidium sp. 414]